MPIVGKLAHIARRGPHRRRRQGPDTDDLHQRAGAGHLAAQPLDASIVLRQTAIVLHQALVELGKHLVGQRRQGVLGILEDTGQPAAHHPTALGQHDPVPPQQASDLVDHCRALLAQQRPRAMQRQYRLLLGRLHRYKSHARPGERLTDRLGIVAVVLVALAVGLDEPRRHQPRVVTQPRQLPRPKVAAAAGFQTDHARCELAKEGQNFRVP